MLIFKFSILLGVLTACTGSSYSCYNKCDKYQVVDYYDCYYTCTDCSRCDDCYNGCDECYKMCEDCWNKCSDISRQHQGWLKGDACFSKCEDSKCFNLCTECPIGWEFNADFLSCYYLVQDTHTDYLSANRTCQKLGGHLAIISSSAEKSWIQTKLDADLLVWQPAWFHYEDTLERYQIILDMSIGFPIDKDCTELYPNGLLNYVNCSNIALPICEKAFSHICPQDYNCQNSSVCLPYDKRCDGVQNCLEGDDEYFCNYNCPDGCTCKDFGIQCYGIEWNPSIIIKPSVKYLKLANNRGFKVLQINMGFPLLLTANFSNNRIQAILPGSFLNQTMMKELDLSGNAIIQLTQDAFIGLINLRLLDLSGNAIIQLTQDAFIGLINLRLLDLDSNAITYLRKSAFIGLPSLQKLDLGVNRITDLGQGVFNGLPSLQTLNLNHNEIRNLMQGAFDGLTSIRSLYLGGNRITDQGQGVFIGLASLQTLDLSYNSILDLKEGAFSGLINIKLLNLNHNKIRNLMQGAFDGLTSLRSLYLGGNRITDLGQDAFNGLASLQTLYLGENRITDLEQGAFNGLASLRTLYLHYNEITYVKHGVFSGMTSLQKLHLNDNKITDLGQGAFNGLTSLQTLYLSFNAITNLMSGVFDGLASLQYLNLRYNELRTYDLDVFNGLISLKTLLSDEFSICCIMKRVPDCRPTTDQFSFCKDLLKWEALRILMLIFGITGFIGNLVVIILRLLENNFNVHSILITNLAVSNLLMVVYMVIIAGADLYYKGVYATFAQVWKTSFLCSFAGGIATLSSELSVFTLMLISFDRAVTIAYPSSNIRLNRKRCITTVCVAWLIVIIISFLPMFNHLNSIDIPYFGDNYYGRQSVCLVLPLARDRLPGWEYAIAIFIAFNLFGFVVVAVSYILIYISIKRTSSSVNRSQGRAEEIKMAAKMAMIALTDFCCWFPIIVMGIGSEVGTWELTADIYTWAATIIFPINSFINPYLIVIAYKRKIKKNSPTQAAIGMRSVQPRPLPP